MLIQASLNGGTTRAEHPAVPLTPAELAAEARAAAAAGARAIHVHPRDLSGAQTLRPEHVLAAVAAVRAATGLPVGVTTGIWAVDGDVRRRMSLVADWSGRDRRVLGARGGAVEAGLDQHTEPPGIARNVRDGAESKRGTEATLKHPCHVDAGVPGLEPRLTGPEPVGLPITPYPKVTRT